MHNRLPVTKCSFCDAPARYRMVMAPGVRPLPICEHHLRRRQIGKWKAGEPQGAQPGEYTRIEDNQ